MNFIPQEGSIYRDRKTPRLVKVTSNIDRIAHYQKCDASGELCASHAANWLLWDDFIRKFEPVECVHAIGKKS